ncbi:MAG TPA: hypothetical protein VG797_08905, partial [Phycisphaerales bacterium]|nr:hypothetical protein [Phycisphaerales bacterium]
MKLTTASVFLSALMLIGAPAPAAPRVSSAPSDADRILTTLLEQDFEDQLRANPVEASSRGYRQYDDLLPDLTAAGREKRSEDARLRLEAVQAINCDDLSPANRVNYALLR